MDAYQNGSSLSLKIKAEAFRLGFCLCGITDLSPLENFEVYRNWIADGYQAGMAYMASEYHMKMRQSPSLYCPEARSVIVLGWPYPLTLQSTQNSGWIAGFALGEDYHQFLPGIAERLVQFISEQVNRPVCTIISTDSNPVLERELGQRAGLGWIGRNSCLISPVHGSTFLLAEIFTDLLLPPDPPFLADRCGSCRRCQDACPTQCIQPNRTLDARRCISYLTIENKGCIPENLQPSVGNWIFGCDLCQSVCPWNQSAVKVNILPSRSAEKTVDDLLDELSLSAEDFKTKYHHSPILRAKWSGYLRNLITVLANLKEERALPILLAMESRLDSLPANDLFLKEHIHRAIATLQK